MLQKPPILLITGATDGLGLALAHHAATQGYRLVLVGRRPLATLSDPLFTPDTYCEADLSQSDCGVRAVAFLQSRGITHLDYLVHNAGVGYVGDIESQSSASIHELMNVNVNAPLVLTQPLLPLLKAARGKIVLISSVVAPHATPRYAVYSATKSALEGWVRSLRLELAGQVRVQVIAPGAIRTAMHTKSGMSASQVRRFPPAPQVAAALFDTMRRDDRNRVIGGGMNPLIRTAGDRFGTLWKE
jgi:short-subunit dehydrogenase